jgi:hypothetical protein
MSRSCVVDVGASASPQGEGDIVSCGLTMVGGGAGGMKSSVAVGLVSGGELVGTVFGDTVVFGVGLVGVG